MRDGPIRDVGTRDRNRRFYNVSREPAAHTPLQSLLALVYLCQQLRTNPEDTNKTDAESLPSIIAAVHRVATGDLDLQRVLDFVVERARLATNASAAVVALTDGKSYVCCSRAGLNAPGLGARLDPESGISGECVRTGAILRCDDAQKDARVNASACRDLNIRSLIAAPIYTRHTVAGVLEVFADRTGFFDQRQTEFLQLLCSLITHALQNEHDPTGNVFGSSDTVAVQDDGVPAETFITGKHYLSSHLSVLAGISAAAILVLLTAGALTRIKPAQPSSDISQIGAPLKMTERAEVTDINFRSHPDFTAIKIKLGRLIPVKAQRFRNPNRVLFDLQESELSTELLANKANIKVDDRYVAGVRLSQVDQNLARIVLELKCSCEYGFLLPERAPYELSIVIQPKHRTPIMR